MKLKIYKIMMYIFGILTIIGASYVFFSKGQASPGFAVIPMIFSIAFSTNYRNEKKRTLDKIDTIK